MDVYLEKVGVDGGGIFGEDSGGRRIFGEDWGGGRIFGEGWGGGRRRRGVGGYFFVF